MLQSKQKKKKYRAADWCRSYFFGDGDQEPAITARFPACSEQVPSANFAFPSRKTKLESSVNDQPAMTVHRKSLKVSKPLESLKEDDRRTRASTASLGGSLLL